MANLIENGVFEDSLFKNDEVTKEFSITDVRVEWQQTSEEDGIETEPTEVPEEEWDDWESVFTGKTLRQVVESNQLAEEPEEGEIEDNEEGGVDGGDDQQPPQLNEDEIARED